MSEGSQSKEKDVFLCEPLFFSRLFSAKAFRPHL
jgi:hypothetical protein